ncbi:hypothetical protein AAC387_Pa02g0531 [Persea americana]
MFCKHALPAEKAAFDEVEKKKEAEEESEKSDIDQSDSMSVQQSSSMGLLGGQFGFTRTAPVDETTTTLSTPVSEHTLSTLSVPLTAGSDNSVCMTISKASKTE